MTHSTGQNPRPLASGWGVIASNGKIISAHNDEVEAVTEKQKHWAAARHCRVVEVAPESPSQDEECGEIASWQYLDQFGNWVGGRNETDAQSWAKILGTECRPLFARLENTAKLQRERDQYRDALLRAEQWARVAHQSCMGTGPKQALGETLNGLHQFLVTTLTHEGGKS